MDNKAPRVTLRQWAVFAAIAQCETTTAAGEQLGLSQSAVSSALAELESTLGHPLFDRHARRLHLNALGRQLLPQAQALLDHADALERATVQPNVRLKLAASSTIGNYVLPALLASFRQQIAPDSQLDVLIGNTQDVVDAVQRFEVDIGLIEGGLQKRNLFLPQRQPFQIIQPNPQFGYFWGRSELADLWRLQDQIAQRMDDIAHITRLQAHPPRSITADVIGRLVT